MSAVSTYPLRRTREGQEVCCTPVRYRDNSRLGLTHPIPGITLVKLSDASAFHRLHLPPGEAGGGLNVVAGRRASHLPSSDQPVDGRPQATITAKSATAQGVSILGTVTGVSATSTADRVD